MGKRAQFATKTGVIAATVGSAVGLGNIWRFPCEAGANGGGAFMLIYIGCVLVLGIPLMLAEFIIGRSTHKNAKGALTQLLPHSKARFVSYLGIIASLMIISFYSVVAGWILEYLFQAITGGLNSSNPQDYSAMFGNFATNPYRGLFWTLLFLAINYLVLRRGVEKGIEKVSNVLMPMLFVILVMFCINSLLMPKASEGLRFLFSPDFSRIEPSTVIDAMGQAFFSLSLGLTCLLTYSSYFSNDTPLVRSATVISVLDTLVAILSGAIIFPAAFSYGLTPEAGPKLVFEILPCIFQQIPGGYFWAIAFFVLLFFASITSSISMSEISISVFMEEGGMKRHSAVVLSSAIAVAGGTLCALSFGPLSHVTIFGMTFFDLFDYVSSNILLPVGGFAFAIIVGWMLDRKLVNEQLTNQGTRHISLAKPIMFCIRYVAPAAILLIFLYSLGIF